MRDPGHSLRAYLTSVRLQASVFPISFLPTEAELFAAAELAVPSVLWKRVLCISLQISPLCPQLCFLSVFQRAGVFILRTGPPVVSLWTVWVLPSSPQATGGQPCASGGGDPGPGELAFFPEPSLQLIQIQRPPVCLSLDSALPTARLSDANPSVPAHSGFMSLCLYVLKPDMLVFQPGPSSSKFRLP